MLLGLVAAGLFVTRNEIIDLLIGQQTPTAAVVPAEPIEPLPEVSQASSVSTGASLPVVVPPLPSEASCPKADPTVSEYRVLEPTKTADFIFVQSKAKQTICVIDLAGKSNMQMMDVGSNYTFTGQAPFTVLTNGISQVSIYFQGRPVRIQGDAIRTIRLLEAK
jgi:hypothetical protein